MKDYYKILEITPSATFEDIKKAYRRLAFKFHPDRNGGNLEFNQLFIEINQAYKTLSHETTRKRYDMSYRVRMARELKPVTPQLFLEKMESIRTFIYKKGKNKISETALFRGLNTILSDNNIRYLINQNNSDINKQIINESLKCCDFISGEHMLSITSRLEILAGKNEIEISRIQEYKDAHKMMKSNYLMEILVNFSHKVSTIFR
ncbi:J domain-containing protein [Apibacter sp. HY039]|uniref:J domain-containing protein n=1 Tax=Apibacter sp. HY039 TaxID=2501476 RepID=UPI000FEBADE7|nr:J domain-containing protein [Apibacter sp. HY039]